MPLTADPLADASEAVVAIIGTTPAPKRRGTLLIVDDEDGPRQSLRVIFKDDYDLLMAEDGPTAIDLAQKNDIDVAVLDIRMAGMSGIEVLERLKYVNPHIEAIMMTAFETTDTIRQALRLRACDYINKPFDLATMRAAVAQAMQRRTLESEIHSSAEKVQELLTELQEQRIEEKIAKTRGDIYASIIHDINGPLTVISGFVQVLNQRLNRNSRMEVGGFGIHQGPAAHHRAASRELRGNLPALPRLFEPPIGTGPAREREPVASRSGTARARASEPARK